MPSLVAMAKYRGVPLCIYADPDQPGEWGATLPGNAAPKHWSAHYDLALGDLLEAAQTAGVQVRRVATPDSADPGWYLNRYLRWRKEPDRQPSLLREGIHAVMGAGLAALIVLALHRGELVQLAMEVNAVALVLFLAYEITEGWRIKDWAYRDIGGAFAGWLTVAGTGLVLALVGVLGG